MGRRRAHSISLSMQERALRREHPTTTRAFVNFLHRLATPTWMRRRHCRRSCAAHGFAGSGAGMCALLVTRNLLSAPTGSLRRMRTRATPHRRRQCRMPPRAATVAASTRVRRSQCLYADAVLLSNGSGLMAGVFSSTHAMLKTSETNKISVSFIF